MNVGDYMDIFNWFQSSVPSVGDCNLGRLKVNPMPLIPFQSSVPRVGDCNRRFAGILLSKTMRVSVSLAVPSPAGGRWHRPSVRNVIIIDLYRPLPAGEVAPLVSPQVAASLDQEGVYGLWCWNTRRIRRWKERGLDGAIHNRVKNETRPREEWVVVPVPLEGSGLSRALADASREVMSGNLRRRSAGTVARRFWQLSGSIARCNVCGNGFSPHTVHSQGKVRTYYRCFTRYNSGRDVCSNSRHMQAPALEEAVWTAIILILSEPERLLRQYKEHLERNVGRCAETPTGRRGTSISGYRS